MRGLKKIITYLLVGCISIVVLNSCSVKKDKFLNRGMHAMATKYNVLYNGNNAFAEGRATLNAEYTDNYWELLPV